MINKVGIIQKGWGYENIFVSNNHYSLKELHFIKAGNKFSLHYHKQKIEDWVVVQGEFLLNVASFEDGKPIMKDITLKPGQTWQNQPLIAHRLTALADDSVIIEVSTMDDSEDNYRIAPGDSQSETPIAK